MQRIVHDVGVIVALITMSCALGACGGGGGGQTRTPPPKQAAPGQGMKDSGAPSAGEDGETAPETEADESGG
jgi:hypothetical protein